MATVRPGAYQNSTNVDGFITANEISHDNQLDPCRNLHPPRTSLYDEKAMEILMKNPLPIHDTFVTTNNVYHSEKYSLPHYAQPQHPKAPGLFKVHCIRPDFHRKVAEGGFNPNPIYDTTETKAQFKPKRRIHDMYGPPLLHIPERHVFVPQYKDFVYPFDKDAAHGAIRMSHPYLTTSECFHRKFDPAELEYYDTLSKLEVAEKPGRRRDVQIKYRVRPMLDPFEQNIDSPNYDVHLQAPAGRLYNVQKYFFKRPPYAGCAPRVFPPVVHLGWLPTYTESYGAPYPNHCINKEGSTHPIKACYLQPKISAAGTMRTPNMYKTENEVYGSGRLVSAFVKTGLKFPELCDQYVPAAKE